MIEELSMTMNEKALLIAVGLLVLCLLVKPRAKIETMDEARGMMPQEETPKVVTYNSYVQITPAREVI